MCKTCWNVSGNKDNFGQQVETYGNIPLINLGTKAGSNDPVVSIDGTTGETSLYAARLGLDGFHAVSMAGQSRLIFGCLISKLLVLLKLVKLKWLLLLH